MLVCIRRSVVPQIENRMAISEVDFRKWFVENLPSLRTNCDAGFITVANKQDAIDKRMRGGDQTAATKAALAETKVAN